MRILLITLMILLLSVVASGQQSKPAEPNQGVDDSPKLGNPITVKQVLELPRRDGSPRITLKQALKIAENFIKKERINISSCYLFEAKWVQDKLDEEPSGHFWWVGVHRVGKPTEDVRITVSMEGKAKVNRVM